MNSGRNSPKRIGGGLGSWHRVCRALCPGRDRSLLRIEFSMWPLRSKSLYSMTRKDALANWAAVLLEDDERCREKTRAKVEALHDCRTAIVHDLSDSGRREVSDDVYSAGFEIARRTLVMHLSRGRFLSRVDRKLLERGIRPPGL